MLKKLYFLAALFWTGIICFFCLEKASSLPSVSFPNLDKIVHAFFHFVFTLLWFLCFKDQLKTQNTKRVLAFTFGFSVLFGIGIEILQQIATTTRRADVFDVLANMTGAAIAVLVLILFEKFVKSK